MRSSADGSTTQLCDEGSTHVAPEPAPEPAPSPTWESPDFGFPAADPTSTRSGRAYPTAALAHGPTLLLDGHDLAEEAVGFGVPVALRGNTAVFPGTAIRRLDDGHTSPRTTSRTVTVDYRLDLAERLVFGRGRLAWSEDPPGGSASPRVLDRAHDHLSSLHRDRPGARAALDAGSRALRRYLRMTTRFDAVDAPGSVTVAYAFPASGTLAVAVDPRILTDPTVTGLAIMNEIGATAFDGYRDSDGLELVGERVESWAQVTAEWAALAAPTLGVELLVTAVHGARLFRGRELADGRLAWAGFAYLLEPPWRPFSYEVRVRPRGGPAAADTETTR